MPSILSSSLGSGARRTDFGVTFFVEKVRNSTKIGFKPRKYPIFGPNFVTIGLLSFSTPGTFIRINTVTAQLTLAGQLTYSHSFWTARSDLLSGQPVVS